MLKSEWNEFNGFNLIIAWQGLSEERGGPMFQNPWYGAAASAEASSETSAEAEAPESSSTVPDSIDGMMDYEADLTPLGAEGGELPIAVIQRNLKSGWTVHLLQDGRLFYCK